MFSEMSKVTNRFVASVPYFYNRTMYIREISPIRATIKRITEECSKVDFDINFDILSFLDSNMQTSFIDCFFEDGFLHVCIFTHKYIHINDCLDCLV